nr:hypothetical protein [Tanacetum cinerariifolium]
MIDNHSMDRLVKDVLIMELVMHTEKNDTVFHTEKTGMLMLVVEIDVGGMTADVVDKLTCSSDDVQTRQVDLRPVAGQNGLGISNKNENAYLKKNNDDGNKASSSINKQVASTSNGFSILSEDTFIADDGITADSVKESTWQRQETMDSDGDDVKNVYDETGTFIRSDVHKTKGASTPISDVSNDLCMHKRFVNDKPWVLMGDFNAALYLKDTFCGSSNINIAMREFSECVEAIEVGDVNSTGLHFTWNQKPKVEMGLDDVVSNNQSVFVLGRCISDNILITQELMHNYHLNRGPPRCAFKVDIQKAYDTDCKNLVKGFKSGLVIGRTRAYRLPVDSNLCYRYGYANAWFSLVSWRYETRKGKSGVEKFLSTKIIRRAWGLKFGKIQHRFEDYPYLNILTHKESDTDSYTSG